MEETLKSKEQEEQKEKVDNDEVTQREQDINKNIYWTDEVHIKIQGEDKFVNEFKIDGNIGKGAYSKVKKVIRYFQGEQDNTMHEAQYAMKMMHKPTLVRERAIMYDKAGEMKMINNLDKVYNEIDVWGKINHENLIKLYELIDSEDHDYLYLILELADLGQIATWDFQKEVYIRNKKVFDCIMEYLVKEGKLKEGLGETEQVARFIFKQLAQAIYHLHEEIKVIHRDIKLDNILFSSKDMKVKLTDFTVARCDIEDDTRLYDSDGTPAFTAPECHIVEKQGYKPKPTDIWSFGVCLYTYVSGKVPFYAQCELEMQINSRTKEVEIPSDFSQDLKELILQLLSKDPNQRPTAYEVLNHKYFN